MQGRNPAMPLTLHEEYVVAGTGIVADIACPELKLVIEVDGPCHFSKHVCDVIVSPGSGTDSHIVAEQEAAQSWSEMFADVSALTAEGKHGLAETGNTRT